MALRLSAFVDQFLAVDFSDARQRGQFYEEHLPALAGGRSAREVVHRRDPDGLDDGEERRKVEVINAVSPDLPHTQRMRRAQERLRSFIGGFDAAVAAGDREEMARACEEWDNWLRESRVAVFVASDGLLCRGTETRWEAEKAGDGLIARAWRELWDANAVDPTTARIARAPSRKKAQEIAKEAWETERGRLVRMIVRERKLGFSPTQLHQRFYPLPRTTILSILQAAGIRAQDCAPTPPEAAKRAPSRRAGGTLSPEEAAVRGWV
jgi:hypothetical protein